MSAPTSAACDRCGTFAVRKPFWGRLLCHDCIDRLAAGPLTLRGLHAAFWTVAKQVGGRVIGLYALCNLPVELLQLAGEKGPATNLLGAVVPAYASALGAYVAVHHAVSGRRVRLVEAASVVRARFLLLGLSSLAALLISFLFTFLLVIPGVMRLLSYALVTTIAVCDPVAEPLDVLQRSQARMKGHRWVALVGYACAYGVSLGPPILVMVFLAGRHLGGAGRFVPGIASGLGSALGGIATLVSATLYVQLTRPDLWPVDGKPRPA